MSLGFEPTSLWLLISPVILLIVAAALDFFLNKEKKGTFKIPENVLLIIEEHNDLYKNMDLSLAENIEKRLDILFKQISEAPAQKGIKDLQEANIFYKNNLESIKAYARNPQAFKYKFADDKPATSIIRAYQTKVQIAEEALAKLNLLDDQSREKQIEEARLELEQIKNDLALLTDQQKNILSFEKNKFVKVEDAIKEIKGEAKEDSLYPLIPAAIGILIGLYVIVTRPELVFWFF